MDDSDYEDVDDILKIHEQIKTEDKNDSKIHGTRSLPDQAQASIPADTEISMEVQNLTVELSMMIENVAVSKSYIWEQFLKKYTFSTEKNKWGEARDICVSQGAGLAVASSIAELAYLKEITEEPHWIGLSDLELEGEWKWLGGREVDKSYWKSGQPDNFNEEDCGEILQTGELNDSHCHTMRLWICEKWCNNTCLLFY
ncbi:C-type lectin domain family 4 member F-like isoform X2 [Acipenser ruthenus]|uniref:C-type lectin domain family 4 member F-like isoform X2 n=1 Tax=Acipenser ruthenus TaxID=7906 RepID=UPI0027421993|nr:C-type lectin domain family 4 member F-like isoform X2 [Acipenser ruthenus]